MGPASGSEWDPSEMFSLSALLGHGQVFSFRPLKSPLGLCCQEVRDRTQDESLE